MDFKEWKGVSVLSGGSFGYLCYKDVPELMNSSSIANLEKWCSTYRNTVTRT